MTAEDRVTVLEEALCRIIRLADLYVVSFDREVLLRLRRTASTALEDNTTEPS